jgi:Family of unknown function (DUF6162)
MSRQEVVSPGRSGSGRERASILLLAALIVGGIGIYLALRVSGSGTDTQRDLLPYQVLARTLPDAEQETFGAIRRGLGDAEAERGRLGKWPEPPALASRGIPPFAGDARSLRWQQFQQGKTVDYLGIPSDPASPAWLLVLQEPEPNMPPDPAPLDDEHHKLPDGTTMHVYVWMHQYGGRVTPGFIGQPQSQGWTQVFRVPPNPLFLPKL